MDRKTPKKSIERFHVTSSKPKPKPKPKLLHYTFKEAATFILLEFHKLSLHPKVWADMEILSFARNILSKTQFMV